MDLGADVMVVDNFSTGRRENLVGVSCSVFKSDVRNLDALKRLAPPNFVFHLASPPSDILFQEKPVECLLSTIEGFINALEFARLSKVKKFIYASSSSVYGKCAPPQSEEAKAQPTNLYGTSKLLCEKIAERTHDVKTVGLRIFAG